MKEQQGILLESGTNGFEFMEFCVGTHIYGVNMAKVSEVINSVGITKLPNGHPWVEGIFTLRGKIMPLINLFKGLDIRDEGEFKIIISELNNVLVGFKVSSISSIHSISCAEMELPPNIAQAQLINGIIKMADQMILLLDFEKILADVDLESNQELSIAMTSPSSVAAA